MHSIMAGWKSVYVVSIVGLSFLHHVFYSFLKIPYNDKNVTYAVVEWQFFNQLLHQNTNQFLRQHKSFAYV